MHVHVRYMGSEIEPCVVWALRVSLPFFTKLVELERTSTGYGPCTLRNSSLARKGGGLSGNNSKDTHSRPPLAVAKTGLWGIKN